MSGRWPVRTRRQRALAWLLAVVLLLLANQWLEQRGETPIDWMPVLPAESE